MKDGLDLTFEAEASARPTVLLVEGNHFLRDTLRTWLEQSDEVELVGEVTNGVDAVEQTLTLKPLALLVDVSLTDMSGLVLARLIRTVSPNTHVILLLDENERAYRSAARETGVAACVVKTAPAGELLATLHKQIGGR